MIFDKQVEFTDEMLHILYSSQLFQSFSEKDQQLFIERYQGNNTFQEMLQLVIGMKEAVNEVKACIPALTDDLKGYFMKPSFSITNRIVIDQNVYYYPFGVKHKEQGPFIVCLQQGEEMTEYSSFCKGLILPLFDMCYREKRDLIVLVFGEKFQEIRFNYGEAMWDEFDMLLESHMEGEAQLLPVLREAAHILTNDEIKVQAEVMIVSNHQIADYNEEKIGTLIAELKALGASLSCIAMNEDQFKEQPIKEVEKVYFVQE